MFGLGPMEMLIVGVIAVLLFGKNLPSVGRSFGKSLMEFKKGLNDIKSEMDTATYASPSTQRVARNYQTEDFDEPTAPKFEPPTGEPTETTDSASAQPAESNPAQA